MDDNERKAAYTSDITHMEPTMNLALITSEII